MKNKWLLVFAAVLMTSLQAFSQMESGKQVVIGEKVNHDLYLAGSSVTINAPVQGDLIVAGGTITVNDSVLGDILIAGGNILLNGYVGDDIRCAGGTIHLSGDLAGDLVVAGGTIEIAEGSTIKGNLWSGAGETTLNGEVKGLIKNTSGTFTLNGKAGNKLDARGGKIIINGIVEGPAVLAANEILPGPSAVFRREVNYWNDEGILDFGNSLSGNQATYDPSIAIESDRWQLLGFASLLMVTWYLGMAALMIILIQYFFNTTFKNAADSVKNSSLRSLGLGFLFLAGIPVAILISFVTVIGLPIGILMLLAYMTVIFFATVLVALIAAHWINNTFYQSSWGMGKIIGAAFGIFVFLKLASLTPFVGPLIMLLLVGMAIGGILLNVKWRRNKRLTVS